MGAKRRQAGMRTAGGLPVALTTRLHPLWQNEKGIRAFITEHDLESSPWFGPLTAFDAVSEAYAVAQGWVRSIGGSELRADLNAMRAAGIPTFGCRLAQVEKRAKGSHRMADADWEFIASAERRNLERG